MYSDRLPQGSPLSVLLFLIYNSSLVISQKFDQKCDKLSIAFMDDVAHLVARRNELVLNNTLQKHGENSLDWGKEFGTTFELKKAQLIYFTWITKKNFYSLRLKSGDIIINPKSESRWLGIYLDTKLTFTGHIYYIKNLGKQTLHQLRHRFFFFQGLSH